MTLSVKSVIEKLVADILSKVNPRWNKLQKIRFCYLALGDKLEKNTDFFENDRLDKYGLSPDEMEDIYHNDTIYFNTNNQQYEVICKSAALILKALYDSLGITSFLVPTKGEADALKHWFVVVQDDNKKQYFLTLAADFPYIKNNFPTKYFANSIRFIKDTGEEKYQIPNNKELITRKQSYTDKDNKKYLVDEIDHKTLSYEELKKLDYSIGYQSLYDIDPKSESTTYKKLFYELSEEENFIYKLYRSCFHVDSYKKVMGIKEEDIIDFEKKLNLYINSILSDILNYYCPYQYDEQYSWLKNYLVMILINSSSLDINVFLTTKEIMKTYKKEFKKIKDANFVRAFSIIQSVINLEDRFNIFNKLRKQEKAIRKRNDISLEEYDEVLKALDKSIINLSVNELDPLLKNIVYQIVKKEVEISPDEYVPESFVIKKFTLMFPYIFDWNYYNNITSKTTSFSKQSYSEQIVIIKDYLKKIFYDLTYKNSCDVNDYNEEYSPVENRIQPYPVKDLRTGEYCIAFYFNYNRKRSTEGEVTYMYTPSKNELKIVNPLVDFNEYWIVSSRFNRQINKLEDIDDVKKR